MRVIFAGDRYFGVVPKKPKPTQEELRIFLDGRDYFTRLVMKLRMDWKDMYGPITEVVSGCANGIDDIAIEVARRITGKSAKKFPAKWFENGKAAGQQRNLEMSLYADGAIIIAGPDSIGSYDMARKMKAKGLPYLLHVVDYDELDLYVPGLPSLISKFRLANKR